MNTGTMSTVPPNVEKDLFKDKEHAKRYLECRPDYCAELWRTILDYQEAGEPGRTLAVDLGCGSGQSTFPLAAHFDRVIGVDVSQAMVELGKEEAASRGYTNVTFKIASAECLDFLPDESVELITCGIAFHWMDADKVYAEAKRVLKPGGAFAIYKYGSKSTYLDNDDATKAMKEVDQKVDPYRYAANAIRYQNIELPFHDVRKIEHIQMKSERPVSKFIGFLWTLAAWQNLYNQDQSLCQSLLADLEKRLLSIYRPLSTDNSDDPTLVVVWPIILLLGRKEVV